MHVPATERNLEERPNWPKHRIELMKFTQFAEFCMPLFVNTPMEIVPCGLFQP